MATRFRKSIKIAPGLKLNVGKKSASVRVGGKNVGHTIGTAGRTSSASVPGTGFGVTHRHKKGESSGGGLLGVVIGIVGFVVLLLIVAAIWPK